jgi:hypothetical protein
MYFKHMARSLQSIFLVIICTTILLGVYGVQPANAQVVTDSVSAVRIKFLLEKGNVLFSKTASVDTLIQFYSSEQLGIPYVSGLLEEPAAEQLVVTLSGSDCVLFVEMTTALTLTTLSGSTRLEDVESNVRLLRYRNGTIDGYFSRLHYFGDWLQDNERKGLLSVLFQDRNTLPRLEPYHFMTTKREAYRQMADNDSLYNRMVQHEAALNERRLRFVPTVQIPSVEQELQTGDIVAFVTTVDGLDVTHTAIVKKDGNRVGFWHASTTGSVIVEPKTLYQYTVDRKGLKGILVARMSYL